jgi:hypothetical protein
VYHVDVACLLVAPYAIVSPAVVTPLRLFQVAHSLASGVLALSQCPLRCKCNG